MLVKATFYLPIRDNDGSDLTRLIQHVEDQCFSAFGAWTMAGHFRGVWRMEGGERKLDTSAVYQVVLATERLPELEAILLGFKSRTSQEALYLEIERNLELRLL